MADEPLQRAFRDACLAQDAEGELGDLRAFLEARGVAAHDVDAMTQAPQRLSIYRRLVRNSLEGVTHRLLARTRARMGAELDRSFDRFLHERGPQTHYLRDVPAEFLAWAEPRWREANVARWLVELARHELVSFLVTSAPKLAEPRAADVALDRPLLLSPLARIEHYAHAVHELGEDEGSPAPPARDVALLYYRDGEYELRIMELEPLAAALLQRAPKAPLQDAVAAACQATARPMSDDVLVAVARLLADLGERGVLLGSPDA